MIRINLNITIEKPKWWYKIFTCRHNVVLVNEGFQDIYGSHTSYMYCLKCGRQAMNIERNCKHKEDVFGKCKHCLCRLSKFDCKHKWTKEPDTEYFYCDDCGEWREE